MNNHERYKKAFDTVKPTKEITAESIMELKEERKMKKGSFGFRRSLVSIVAAVVLLVGVTGGAYATDIGGFKKTVDTWLYGEQVEVEIVEKSEGEFSVIYPNGYERITGGLSYGPNGEEIPFTAEDVAETLDYPEIDVVDGRVIMFYRDQSVDITDDVNDDGKAKVVFQPGALKLVVNVEWNSEDSYSVSTHPSIF